MLREFVESSHYKFAEKARDWEDAVRMSCESLESDGTVEANYNVMSAQEVETKLKEQEIIQEA